MMASILRFAQWFLFLLLTFMLSLTMSWLLLAKVDFAYPLLHDYAGISENIDHYGPLNPLRPHFEQTTREERLRLFHGIVEGIHHQGDGLSLLLYHDSHGRPVNTLLTEAEIIHLQDVANLLDVLKAASLPVLLLWVTMLVLLQRYRQPLPGLKQLLAALLGLGGVVVAILALGAKKFFYQMHEWIFPDEHQWFFYYEESLMSMMMKAPVLFGYITVMMLAMAIVITVVMIWLYHVRIAAAE